MAHLPQTGFFLSHFVFLVRQGKHENEGFNLFLFAGGCDEVGLVFEFVLKVEEDDAILDVESIDSPMPDIFNITQFLELSFGFVLFYSSVIHNFLFGYISYYFILFQGSLHSSPLGRLTGTDVKLSLFLFLSLSFSLGKAF